MKAEIQKDIRNSKSTEFGYGAMHSVDCIENGIGHAVACKISIGKFLMTVEMQGNAQVLPYEIHLAEHVRVFLTYTVTADTWVG